MTRPRTAPSLVLLPPLGVPAGMLSPLLPALSGRGPVALHDLPGQGLGAPSPRSTLAGLAAGVIETLDAAGFERADACGFGFGGIVALQLALDHPERIDRLVVACASAAPGNQEAYRARAQTVRATGLGAVAEQIVLAWMTRWDPVLGPRLAAMLISCDARSYAGHCDLLADVDLTAAIAAITAPTLALAAADDRGLAPQHSRRLARAMPSCAYQEVGGAAHLPWLEQPAAVCAAINQHLTAHDRRTVV